MLSKFQVTDLVVLWAEFHIGRNCGAHPATSSLGMGIPSIASRTGGFLPTGLVGNLQGLPPKATEFHKALKEGLPPLNSTPQL